MKRKWKCVRLDLVDDHAHSFRQSCRDLTYEWRDDRRIGHDYGPRSGHDQCGFITPLGVMPPPPGDYLDHRIIGFFKQ